VKNGRLRRPGVIRRKPKSINKNGKARMNFVIPAEMYFWIVGYAEAQNTCVTQLILDYFKQLKTKWEESHSAEQI
jgi:hypothetical protein